LALPVISGGIGLAASRGLKCTRIIPTYLYEGIPVRVEVRLSGRPKLLGSFQITNRASEWIGFSQETELLDDNGSSMVSYMMTAYKRGIHKVGPVKITATDPLGFFRFNTIHPLTTEIVALPRPLPIPNSQTQQTVSLEERHFEGIGRKGTGIEFHGVREYQPGDELRRVHWKSTARHAQLNVIEFEYGHDRNVTIVIDLQKGAEIGTGLYTSLDYACKFAAYIAEQVLTSGSSVRLLFAGSTGLVSKAGRGSAHLHLVFDTLARLKADQDQSLYEVLLADAKIVTPASKIICLTSTISEGLIRFASIPHLTRNGLQVILITIDESLPSRTEEQIEQLITNGVPVTVINCSSQRIYCCPRAIHAS
ncbi:MAG: DUF58 domain-containing protein, partial [Armatimonadota bacterium]